MTSTVSILDLQKEFLDLEKRMSKSDSDTENDDVVSIGRIVVLDGLQSATGKQINGKYAMVLSPKENDDGRWECKVLHRDRTVGIKPNFMSVPQPEEEAPHPDYMEMVMYKMAFTRLTVRETQELTFGKFRNGRGICYNDESVFHRATKLVQLLDYPDEDHTPAETVMLGVSDLFYSSLAIHEDKFQKGCSLYDLEHMAACISLACMAQGHPEARNCPSPAETCECILFALMGAAPRSIETVLGFIVMTPYIGNKSDYDESLFRRSRDNPVLTHAQDNAAYIDVMKGPIGLLCFLLCGLKKECSRALFLYMEKNFEELFPLMIRRLFSFLARESAGTADGKVLGKYTRNILARICDFREDGEFPAALYYYLCECDSFEYRPEAQQYLVSDLSITKLGQIEEVMMSIVDPKIATAFYKEAFDSE